MSYWDPSDRILELGKKKLGEITQDEWEEYQRLLLEWVDTIKEELKKEWDWSEEDWQNSLYKVDDVDLEEEEE